MSNPCYITVGTFSPLGSIDHEDSSVVVIAKDSYGHYVEEFDNLDQFTNAYPTEQALVSSLLHQDVFDGGVAFNDDGTFELDSISHIEVIGFPE